MKLKNILLSEYANAETFDKNLTDIIWKELRNTLLNSKLIVKSDSETEIFIDVPNTEKADIELYPVYNGYDTGFVTIRLWYYKFSKHNKRYKQSLGVDGMTAHKTLNSVTGCLRHVDKIIDEVQKDLEIKKLHS